MINSTNNFALKENTIGQYKRPTERWMIRPFKKALSEYKEKWQVRELVKYGIFKKVQSELQGKMAR